MKCAVVNVIILSVHFKDILWLYIQRMHGLPIMGVISLNHDLKE